MAVRLTVCSSMAIAFLNRSEQWSRRCGLLGDGLRFVVRDDLEVSSEKVAGDFATGQVRDQFAVDAQILECHVFDKVGGIAAGEC